MMKIVDEKANSIEEGKADSHIYFVYSPTFNSKQFMANAAGVKEKYSFTFTKSGKLIKADKTNKK